MVQRSSGIFLPISSLPSKYGIGTFGKEAYEFVDFLCKAGQKYWQILPMGPVSFGDSPYSPFSVYAGNPYYIDLEMITDDGLISFKDSEILLSGDKERIDYEMQFIYRYKILYKAFINAGNKYDNEIDEFKKMNKWVLDYAIFMSLKYKYDQKPWYKWDNQIANRNEKAINDVSYQLRNEISFWIFIQYIFHMQYFKLKEYANSKGISIIGDIPIYAAEDSSDVWCNKKVFIINEENTPLLIAGVPPDDFSDDGQLWGNPVFNWEFLRETCYKWWVDRIEWSFKLYDVLRIDHFRGFDEFWAVKYGSENAIDGKWMPAYGMELFGLIKEKNGKLSFIAEDLGIITESVIKLIKDTGFPGMKVLQFAFDGNPENPYLPENFEKNSVAYTGTHDNDTLKGWYLKLDMIKKQYISKILKINEAEDEELVIDQMISSLLKSKSSLCIVPLQDYLCLGSEARINTPSTLGLNWRWRVKKEYLSNKIIEKIRKMTVESKR
jgi:4-alpha-glucanotransferase